MMRLGFVGSRGMVGSVLLARMLEEHDFLHCETVFFSTSQKDTKAPSVPNGETLYADAYDVSQLETCDIVMSCQGSDYTQQMYPCLRKAGWAGYFIDAASALRMEKESIIVLDPVNADLIEQGLDNGVKDFIGGNCTVSLMLMGLIGLFRAGLVEWVSSMTYQAASGAGAQHMRELMQQMGFLASSVSGLLTNPASSALEIDRVSQASFENQDFPMSQFGTPLAANVLPWIDREMSNGQSREEWKGMAETHKILQTHAAIPIDGLCVRVGVMRCHAQALTIKLTRDVSLSEIEVLIADAHTWVHVVPNEKEASLKHLTPAAVSGTLRVPVGRLRKMTFGPQYLSAFTVGDQLLWGAAEPLRRVFRRIVARASA